MTDVARDATVQRDLLERMLVESERDAAGPLLESLRERESAAMESARRTLERVRYKVKGSA